MSRFLVTLVSVEVVLSIIDEPVMIDFLVVSLCINAERTFRVTDDWALV